MDHEVFISYATGDAPIADAVCARLEAAGLGCWMAPRDILPGNEWAPSIVRAIDAAKVFVLVFSARSNDSPHVRREVGLALEARAIVVPFRVEDVTPSEGLSYYIGGAHWLDAVSRPLDPHLDVLAVDVRRLLDGDSAPRRSGPDAIVTPPASTAQSSAPAAAAVAPPADAAAVSATVAPAPAPARRRSGVVVAAGVAILVLVGALFLSGAFEGESSARAARQPRGSVTTSSTIASTTTTPLQDPGLRLVVTQLDTLLVDAFNGFQNLNQQILGPFNRCEMSGNEAAYRVNEVISNRQNILNSLNALQPGNPTAQDLVAKFRHAIQLSLDSDFKYQAWLGANPGLDCPRVSTPDKESADAIGRQATPAKQAFVAAYDPVAVVIGVKSDWGPQF